MADDVKKDDQVRLLEACRTLTDTGEWQGLFTYPACGWDLVRSGLVTEDKRITVAGRAALWFLGRGDDPLPASASSTTVTIPIPDENRRTP